MRKYLIRLLGGFTNAEEAITSVTELKEKYRLLTLATKRFFNTISQEDILQPQGKTWLCEGKLLSASEKNLLISEAAQLLNSKLWKVLQADVKWQANRKMFIDGRSDLDIIAGKLWLYTLDVFKTRLESLSKESALFNVQTSRR